MYLGPLVSAILANEASADSQISVEWKAGTELSLSSNPYSFFEFSNSLTF